MNILEKLFLWILYSSLTSTVIVLVIFLVKGAFKNQLSPRFHHILWFLVLVRLLVPFIPESNLSLFNLFSKGEMAPIKYDFLGNKYLIQEEIDEKDRGLNYDLEDREEDRIDRSVEEDNFEVNNQTLLERRSHLSKRVLNICSYIWLIGLLSIGISISVSVLKFNRRSKLFNEVTDLRSVGILETCKEKLDVNRDISIYSGRMFRTPFIYGLFNPKIYLPIDVLNTIDDCQLLHIYMHEVAHYKRKDIFYNLLGIVAVAIHWFNPIIWFAMKEMEVDRELACDNYVLEVLGEDESIPYGMTIIKLSKIISDIPYKNILSANFYKGKSQIERRITMIKMFKRSSCRKTILSILLIIMLGTTTLTNAVGFKNEDKKFEFHAPIKTLNSLDRVKDFVDFEFKVPDNIPEGYRFFRIKLDEEKVIDINFEKYEDNRTHNFSFLISNKDIIEYLKAQDSVIDDTIKSNIDFDIKPMTLANVEGNNVVITQNFQWTEDDIKELEKNNTEDIKHTPINEVVNKYFVWKDGDIWYALQYYFRTMVLEDEYNLDRLPTKEDVLNIITSLKYSHDVKNTDYIAEKFVREHLNIYDEKDLKEVEEIIGFTPKFPLTLPGGFVANSSKTYHFIYEGETDSSISITTTFHLKDQEDFTSKVKFYQTKNTFYYDNISEGEASNKNFKTIDGIKVLEESKDRSGETIKKQCYIWKQGDIVYTVEFSGNIDNQYEIIKTLIDME